MSSNTSPQRGPEFSNQAKRRSRILFSRKDDWEPHIRARLKKFDADFADFSDSFLPFNDYDGVLPLTLDAAAHLRSLMQQGHQVRCLLPREETISLCNDKVAFNRFLLAGGFGAHVPDLGAGVCFPYVLKRPIDEWGQSTVLIQDVEDEEKYSASLKPEAHFKQAYIRGNREYACHLLVVGGRITFARTIEFGFSKDHFVFGKWAEPDTLKEINHSHFYPLFSAILEQLGYQGFCCFDYKLDAEGQPKIFELNPRVGGSLRHFINNALNAYLMGIKT
ncbi:hypothetical protein [Kordiimonas sp.]|uniref:hypothetical protein n=1 Tax=Kordiimonas sp. TaxID=1970157 RepID=UPI003A8EF159